MKKKKKSELQKEYPRIYEIGARVSIAKCGTLYVDMKILHPILKKKGWLVKFNDFFGVQTCLMEGPYPWDVDNVLERIMSGRKVGTQLIWD